MQTRSFIALIAILLISCVAGSFTNAQQTKNSDSNATIKELLTQRRDTLAERVKVLKRQHTAGTMTVDSFLSARDQLLDAELELATGTEQRLKLYRERLNNMRKLEDAVKQRFEVGAGTLESTLSTTAARLQAKIDLLREQS